MPQWLWSVIFLISNFRTVYAVGFVVLSGLGLWINAAFFAAHVLDIAMRNKLLGYVLQSVVSNGQQVLLTFIFAALITWIYAVVGVYGFGFNQYSYGDSPEDFSWSPSLQSAFWQHLDFGFRGPPIFNSYEPKNAAGKYVFDISYQILIIFLLLAIVTGIIIDTFSQLRQAKEDVESNMENVCFVCNLRRDVFERKLIKFAEHIELHHHIWNYTFYKLYLEAKPRSELTALEKFLLRRMEGQSIDYFPVERSMALAESEGLLGEKGDEDVSSAVAAQVLLIPYLSFLNVDIVSYAADFYHFF